MNTISKTLLDLQNNQEQRIQAAFRLENIATSEAIQILGKALQTDPSPIVRHECAFALGETAAAQEAGKFLIQAIQTDNSIFVVHEALLALGTLGDKSFEPFIATYLNHPQQDIAESAAIALQRLCTK
ncbi:MAG: HEAT repeat domain-containing protein [Nanoarchaeota archaeon]|nr:HEAT repeat domain-containing protein [Nanoarchaeota archaeon]